MATNVVNLGTAEYRPSIFAGALKSSEKWADRAATEREKGADRVAEAKNILLKDTLDKKKQTTKFVEDAYKNLWGKPESERALFLDTDQGKEFQKLVKTYMPEAIDENGKMIPFVAEEKAYAPKTEEEALQFKKKTEEIVAKVKAGQSLDAADAIQLGKFAQVAMDGGYMDEETGKALIAYSISIIKKSQGGQQEQPAPDAATKQSFSDMFPATSKYTTGLGGVDGSITGGVDPLGILGR